MNLHHRNKPFLPMVALKTLLWIATAAFFALPSTKNDPLKC